MGRRPPIRTLVAALVAACLLVPTGALLHGDTPLLQVDAAFVTQDDSGHGWVIGNELIKYSLGQVGSSIGVRSIQDVVTGRDWHRTSDPDSFAVINGQRVDIGSAVTVFEKAETSEWYGGVRLDVTYRLASSPLEITRRYACYPGSSVIETWTTFHATGTQSVTLSDLTNFAFILKNGNLHWLGGMQVPDEDGGPFTYSTGDLDDGQTFELGSENRASETSIPWFGLRAEDTVPDDGSSAGQQFFGSILWGGSWHFRIRRQGDDVALQLGLPAFTTTLSSGASLDTPHAAFGMTNPVTPEVSLAMRGFIEMGIRHGRTLRADVTYNTWFTYGTFIDEGSMKAEMDVAAGMGVEQFVVDAGWWFHINPEDSSDFERNLGNWQVDPERFPSGLGALTDYAHQLGMRFGVWVEPERVSLETVGKAGLAEERFLATRDGRYDPDNPNSDTTAAQVCLADPNARQWVLSKLHAFLDDVHPDYLKWDNNFWINCNRTSHGHGTDDGNFQHMRGLDTVLDDLRQSYPDMDIENCASGGNRLSLGMLAYSDVGWMDDRSAPSTRVRHDIGGLSILFPPAYLFSFAMGNASESMDDSDTADLSLLVRSRMSGMLGGTWSGGSMSDGTRAATAKQIALYKRIRPVIQHGSAFLLGPQLLEFPDSKWSGWDTIENILPSSGEAVVFSYETEEGPDSTIIKPRALRPDAQYDVESADFGMLGTVGGAELMNHGIEESASGVTHSHVLIFHLHQGD